MFCPKKYLIIQDSKPHKNFSLFSRELSELQKQKNLLWKFFLYFGKQKYLATSLKRILILHERTLKVPSLIKFLIFFWRNRHTITIFFIIFVTNEIFKILFTKRKLIRYYYFINIYIVFWNRSFTLIKFIFLNFNIMKFCKFFIHFLFINGFNFFSYNFFDL